MKNGDKAPDFVLPDQNGDMVRMSEINAQGPVVLFFYPKDGSPLCTREACSFRDNYAEFTKYNSRVLGISSNNRESHQDFADSNHLSFPLLTDADGAVRKTWQASTVMGLLPGRVTYVIDASGIVRNIFSSQLEAERHVSTALEAVKKLSEEK